MFANFPLAAAVEAVAPHLDPQLASRRNIAAISAVAQALEGWRSTGFECRLGHGTPRADFGVHLTDCDSIPTGELAASARTSTTRRAWQSLDRFVDAWSALAEPIPSVSLEFDLAEPWLETVAAPSVFFTLSPSPSRDVRATCELVRMLLVILTPDVPEEVRVQLDRSIAALLPHAAFIQFGVWLTRPGSEFRVCAPGFPFDEVRSVVNALRWQGPSHAYEAQWRGISRFGDRGTLHLDVGREVSTKLGLEMPFGESSACLDAEDPASTRFLDHLVANEWCVPVKRDAVLAWVGGFRVESVQPTTFLRIISHVKMTFEIGREPVAKAYLATGSVPSVA